MLSLAKSKMRTVSKFQMIPTKTVFTQMNKVSLCDGLVQLLRLNASGILCISGFLGPVTETTAKHSLLWKPLSKIHTQ